MAYKDMFETAISQDQGIRSLVNLYTSIPDMLFVRALTGSRDLYLLHYMYGAADRDNQTGSPLPEGDPARRW